MRLGGAGAQDEPEIGLVPLIDVVLTLIIFFVLTTTFEDRAALKVSLPEASVAPQEAMREPLLVVVDEKGTYFVGGNEVLKPEAADLRAAIEKVAGNERERQVLLRADARAPWQAGVTAMDVLGQLGFANVSIATVQAGETPAVSADVARGSAAATYRRLLSHAKPYWIFALLALLGMIFDAGVTGLFTYLIKPMLDELFVARNSTAISWMPALLVGLFLLRGVATYLTDYGMARIGRSVVRDLRVQVFGHYQRLPAAYFDREPSGKVISRIVYSAEQVAQACAEAVKVSILDGLTVLAMLAVMLWHSASLTLYLFVMVPLTALVWQFVGKRYRRINRRIQGSMGDVTGRVEEAVEGNREVRIYGAQAREAERFDRATEQALALNLKIASTNALSTSTIQIVAASALAAIVWRATRPDLLDTMGPGTFMSLITAMLVMLPSLKRLTTVQAMMQRGVAAARGSVRHRSMPAGRNRRTARVAVEAQRAERSRCGDAYRLSLSRARPVRMRCSTSTLRLSGGQASRHWSAVRAVARPRLANLIPRFYEPDVWCQVLPRRRGALTEWSAGQTCAAQIALVSQHVVLFNGILLRENIAYGALHAASDRAR